MQRISVAIILDVRKLLGDACPGSSRKAAAALSAFFERRISHKAVEKWRARSIIRADWLMRVLVYAERELGKKLDIHDYILIRQGGARANA